jgi:plastocyanin
MRTVCGRLVSLAFAGITACGDGDSSGTGPAPGPEPEVGPVSVRDNFFQPASVAVSRLDGTAEVTWSWAGGNLHNVTFDAGPPHSETQISGSFRRSFTEAGAFTYYCTVHGREVMSGTVTIE